MYSKWSILSIIGILTGFLSGLFGLGGGIIMVPALTQYLGMQQHQAQGTSLATLLLPIGILGVWKYYQNNALNIEYASYIAIFFVIGAYLGAHISLKTNRRKLQYIFTIYLLFISLKLMFF